MINLFGLKIYTHREVEEAKAEAWSEGWNDAHKRILKNEKEALREYSKRPAFSEVNLDFKEADPKSLLSLPKERRYVEAQRPTPNKPHTVTK